MVETWAIAGVLCAWSCTNKTKRARSHCRLTGRITSERLSKDPLVRCFKWCIAAFSPYARWYEEIAVK